MANPKKIIKAVKSGKGGAYTFKEEIVPAENVQEALKAQYFSRW